MTTVTLCIVLLASKFLATHAVIARLSTLVGAVEKEPSRMALAVVEADGRIAFEGLTLYSPESGSELVKNLTADVPRGTRVLVVGPNEAARTALFRATAGDWPAGLGKLVRPPLDSIFFLTQRPYLPPGTLPDFLSTAGKTKSSPTPRSRLPSAMQAWTLSRRGLVDWTVSTIGRTCSRLGEQQLLALTRLILARPSFAILDRVNAALKPAQVRQALRRLDENSISYITESVELYDAVLEIDVDGTWSWRPTGGLSPQAA